MGKMGDIDGAMAGVIRVSASQIQSYMSCTRKWHYEYGLGIVPRIDRPYLSIGRLCHRGFECAMRLKWADPDSDIELLHVTGSKAIIETWQEYIDGIDMLDSEVPEFEKILHDSLAIFHQSLDEFDPSKYDVVTCEDQPAVEIHFDMPLLDGDPFNNQRVRLHGYIDAILRDKETGMVWCVDYKFRRTLSPDEEEAYSIQNTIYTIACEHMGINIAGTMTWQHSNTPAAAPKLNKDGSMSRSKIKTTWKMYRSALLENGLDPADYSEMEEKLAENEFYRATLEYRSDISIERIMFQIIRPLALQIWKDKGWGTVGIPAMYPWNCKMCQYSQLCQAELRGYDTEYIIENEFVEKKDRQ